MQALCHLTKRFHTGTEICLKGAVYSIIAWDSLKEHLGSVTCSLGVLCAPVIVLCNLTTVARHGLLVYKTTGKYEAPTNKPHWLTSWYSQNYHSLTINQLKVKALLILAQIIQEYPFMSVFIWFFTGLSSCLYWQIGGETKVWSCPKYRSDILSNILTGNTLSAVTVYLQRLWQFQRKS